MAPHIFIVASMLVAGLATSTHAAPSAPSLTVDTCGVIKPCGVNDTFHVLCPASTTCNEYLECDHGVASVKKCDKAWYLIFMASVYDTSKNCCKLIFSLSSPVKADENGMCPVSVEKSAQDAKDDADANGHVKRHAKADSGDGGATSALLDQQTTAKPDNRKDGEKVSAPSATHLPQAEAEPVKKEDSQIPEEHGSATKDTSASSANVLTAPFIAIAMAVSIITWIN